MGMSGDFAGTLGLRCEIKLATTEDTEDTEENTRESSASSVSSVVESSVLQPALKGLATGNRGDTHAGQSR